MFPCSCFYGLPGIKDGGVVGSMSLGASQASILAKDFYSSILSIWLYLYFDSMW